MAHRYRLYPSPAQLPVLRSHCGRARWVWNEALRAVKAHAADATVPFFDLTKARRETDWLATGSSSIEQQALRGLTRAFANARAGTHRFPRWRRRGTDEGFCVRDVTVATINHRWAEITVPKAGRVRFRLSRRLPEDCGMARVTLDSAGWWHVSFAAAQPPLQREPTGAVVGIDRGVASTIATSDGSLLRAPKLRPGERRRIERLQQELARQQEGLRCREQTKAAIAGTHAKAIRRRNDWIERRTTELVSAYDVIAVEDLKVKSMVRAPKPRPDPEQEGSFLANGRRAKAGVNRAVLDQSWGRFLRRLEDKAAASGVVVVRVDPAYTSQTCRACGHVARENRESQAAFSCVACGHESHADLNAATNVLARGIASLALTPGHGAGPGDRAARRSPAPAGSENLLAGAVA